MLVHLQQNTHEMQAQWKFVILTILDLNTWLTMLFIHREASKNILRGAGVCPIKMEELNSTQCNKSYNFM